MVTVSELRHLVVVEHGPPEALRQRQPHRARLPRQRQGRVPLDGAEARLPVAHDLMGYLFVWRTQLY